MRDPTLQAVTTYQGLGISMPEMSSVSPNETELAYMTTLLGEGTVDNNVDIFTGEFVRVFVPVDPGSQTYVIRLIPDDLQGAAASIPSMGWEAFLRAATLSVELFLVSDTS